MPATYSLLPDRKLVYTKVYGPVTENDFLKHIANMRKLFEQNQLDESWSQLIFLDEVSYVGAEIIPLIRKLVKQNPWPVTCRRVIVSSHKYYFGLARIYQQLADPEHRGIDVVSNLDDAERHLNVNKP